MREADWENFLVDRASAEAAAEANELAGVPSSESEELPAADGGGDAGGDVVVNGATLPAHLLARSASARERLGG